MSDNHTGYADEVRRRRASERIGQVGSWEWRLSDNHLWWSEQIFEIFGVDRATFVPTLEAYVSFVHPDDQHLVEGAAQAQQRGEPYAVRHRIVRSDGEVRVVFQHAERVFDADGQHFAMAGTIQDITERHNREVQDATLWDNLPDQIVSLGETGEILHVNHAGALLGVDSVGARLVDRVAPEHVEPLEAALAEIQSTGETARVELCEGGPPDQRHYAVRVVSTQTSVAAVRAMLVITDQTEQRRAEIALQQLNLDLGGRVEVLLAEALRDAEASRALRAKTRQAERMDALGKLAGGVAHDFNNLLAVIISNAHFAADSIPSGSEARRDIDRVLEASKRAAELAGQLLSFSQRRPVQPVVLDINAAIVRMRELVTRTFGPRIELILNLTDEPLPVAIDPGQLDQVFLNISLNARDAMPEGGTLTFSTSLERTDNQPTADVALITIADTGLGMAPDVIAKVFDPFFTTKGSEGTGLGLSTCFGIIEQAGGEILAASSLGDGSVFSIRIPLSSSALASTTWTKTPAGPVARAGTVLVVEDNVQLLQACKRTLARAGFDVIAATSAEEARILVADRLSEIDLVVSDVRLPGITGLEFAHELRSKRPDLPILHVSGYMAELPTEEVTDARTAYLPKPFQPDDLAAAVLRLLTKAS